MAAFLKFTLLLMDYLKPNIYHPGLSLGLYVLKLIFCIKELIEYCASRIMCLIW